MRSHYGKSLWGGLVVLLLLVTVRTSEAVQYQLQIANLEDMLFSSYVEGQGAPLQAERHVLPRLETELDGATFPVRALLSGYSVQTIAPAVAAAGQFEPVVLSVTEPQRNNPWMVASWEGTPGKTVLLQVSGFQANYQELRDLAVNTHGVLRRLPVYGVPLFGSKKMLAPALSSTYLNNALEHGTFGSLVSKYATPQDGLSVIVGRNDDPQYPDTVYFAVQMPPEAKTYKVVLAWKNRESLEKGGDHDKGREIR